jgi:hypothetical protein
MLLKYPTKLYDNRKGKRDEKAIMTSLGAAPHCSLEKKRRQRRSTRIVTRERRSSGNESFWELLS